MPIVTCLKHNERVYSSLDSPRKVTSFSSFSFADKTPSWANPAFNDGFRSLRVLNEDFIAMNSGFDTHEHADMEIFTIILNGGISHRDDIAVSRGGTNGEAAVCHRGGVSHISAGTGMRHSEFGTCHVNQIHPLPHCLPHASLAQPLKKIPTSSKCGLSPPYSAPHRVSRGDYSIGRGLLEGMILPMTVIMMAGTERS